MENSEVNVGFLLQENAVKIYDNEQITDIINDILRNNSSEKAFYIIDLGKIIQQYNRWYTVFPLFESGKIRHLFSVKRCF